MTIEYRDFKENKIHYMHLFEKSMQKEQDKR